MVSVGYLVEKYRRDEIYCRVGISYIDPDTISPKTHITELVSTWVILSVLELFLYFIYSDKRASLGEYVFYFSGEECERLGRD